MLDRMRQATAGYPRQFWLLFWGMLINAAWYVKRERIALGTRSDDFSRRFRRKSD